MENRQSVSERARRRQAGAKVGWWRSQPAQIVWGGLAGILLVLPVVAVIRNHRIQAAANAMAERAAAQQVLQEQTDVGPRRSGEGESGRIERAGEGTERVWENRGRGMGREEVDEPGGHSGAVMAAPEASGNGDPRPDPDAAPLAVEPPEAAVESPATETVPPEESLAAADEPQHDPDPAERAASDEAAEAQTEAARDQRLPVPEPAEQAAAEQQIRRLLRDDFAAAGPDQQLALARKLITLGDEAQLAMPPPPATGDPLPAASSRQGTQQHERYVLYRLAEEFACDAQSLPVAVEAIGRIAADWRIDRWERQTAAAARLVTAARQVRGDVAAFETAVAAARELAEQAVDADRFAAAGEIVEMLVTAARRARSGDLVRELIELQRQVRQREQAFAAYERARTVLAAYPDDDDANLAAGRWLGLVKNRWDDALPLLARSSDAAWSPLADRDLAAPAAAAAAADQASLADAWWQQARKETGSARSQAARRAVHWYDQALEKLAGLEKIQLNQRRLEALSTVGDPEAAGVPGAVEEGDVAVAKRGTTLSSGDKITYPENLLDGVIGHVGYSKCPFEWTITFAKVYRLQEIRLYLFLANEHWYQFAIAVSADGRTYVPLAERTSQIGRRFEQFSFPAQPVKSIKLIGIRSSYSGNHLMAHEFEAYCIPPDVE